MKKLVLIFYLLGACLALKAQDTNKIHIGMDAGLTVSFFDQKNAPYSDPTLVEEFNRAARPSFEVGATVDYIVSDLWSFSSGLVYTERGGGYRTKNPAFVYVNQFSGAQQSDAYNYLRYRLAYVELPITVNIDVFEILDVGKDDEKLNVFIGASALANVASKLRWNVFEGRSDPDEKWESEKIDGAHQLVFALNTGVEWRGGSLSIYLEYSDHLTDIYNTPGAGESFDVSMSTISLGMGVWF